MKKDFRNAFNLKVQHDEAAGKFFVRIGQDKVSVNYEATSKDMWTIREVSVPSQVRSMNIHSRLMEYVLELALQEKIVIRPACAYAQSFIKRHSRFESLVPQGVTG